MRNMLWIILGACGMIEILGGLRMMVRVRRGRLWRFVGMVRTMIRMG